MREILFRGKRLDNGEWVEGFYYHLKSRYKGDKSFMYDAHKITTGIEETSGAYGEDSEFIEYNVIPETIGQYTGLTDKNGTKIFEGDILIYTDKDQDKSTHKVFWSDTRLAFYACYTRYPELYGYASNFNKDDIEVIGNIHDNPELLKGGEG